MKHATLLVAALAAALIHVPAGAQGFAWAQRMGGTAADSTFDVSVDGNGNAFVAGMFQNTATFGGACAALTSAGDFDIFFARYGPNGNCVWARRWGGAGYDAAYDVDAGAGGRLYATGMYTSPATIGTPVAGAQQEVFVARLDPANGNVIWVRTGGGPNADMGVGVTSDAAGNVYATGNFIGAATWGSASLVSAGGTDIVIAAYDQAGVPLWTRRAGGTMNDEAHGLVIDPGGRIYLTGFYGGTAAFGTLSLTTTAQYQAFLARYNSAGTPVWAVNAGAPNAAWGNAVSVRTGSVYVAGRQALNAQSMFVGAYSPGGVAQWVRVTTGAAQVFDIQANAAGATLLTGSYSGALSFAGGTSTLPLPAGGAYDVFAVQYDAAGEPVWARTAGGAGNDAGLGVDLGPGGVGYVAGAFTGTGTWAPLAPLTSAGGNDGFVSRLSCVRPPANLMGWWPMDGTAQSLGTAVPNNGTLAGGAVFGGGRVNQGVAFGGNAAVMQVPGSTSLDIPAAGTGGAGNFTIDFWIRVAPAAAAGVRTVLDKRDMTMVPLGYHVALFNGVPLVQLADGTGATNYSAGFGSVADGSWHFVAVTVDRQSTTGIRWYLDGVPAGTVSNPTNRPGTLANTANLLIGNHQTSPGSALVGSLDELEIFSRVLTPTEIAGLFNAPYGKCR